MKKVLQADRALRIIPGVKCWTSKILTAFGGLQRSELHEHSVRNGSVINFKEFAVDLHTRAEAAPCKAPRFLNLDLGRHVQRDMSRFRLRTHTMEVERACWQTGVNGHYQKAEQSNYLAEGQLWYHAMLRNPGQKARRAFANRRSWINSLWPRAPLASAKVPLEAK
eukprot:1160736-Pelagomonas_calceolata.AAC.17